MSRLSGEDRALLQALLPILWRATAGAEFAAIDVLDIPEDSAARAWNEARDWRGC